MSTAGVKENPISQGIHFSLRRPYYHRITYHGFAQHGSEGLTKLVLSFDQSHRFVQATEISPAGEHHVFHSVLV